MGKEKVEHTAVDLTKVATCHLCNELKKREAVNFMWVEPYAIKEVTVKDEGPCVLYIVYD